MREISIDYTFTTREHDELFSAFNSLSVNPYTSFEQFTTEIGGLLSSKMLPTVLLDIAQYAANRDSVTQPFVRLVNCPIDVERPIFQFEDPVRSKYELKKTFIAERFLAAFSQLTDQEIVRYRMMNNGDAFHDIYPMKNLAHSMSQKSVVSLGMHQDFPIHFARPRFVNMIGMRTCNQNAVYSTFVRNTDVISSLSRESFNALSCPTFFTPYDDVTKHGDSQRELNDGDGVNRPIIVGNMLNYYQGRTTSTTQEGALAISSLNSLLTQQKTRINIQEGELISFDNDNCLHGRDVDHISNLESHQTRWLIKAHTVSSLDHRFNRLVPGCIDLVNG